MSKPSNGTRISSLNGINNLSAFIYNPPFPSCALVSFNFPPALNLLTVLPLLSALSGGLASLKLCFEAGSNKKSERFGILLLNLSLQ